MVIVVVVMIMVMVVIVIVVVIMVVLTMTNDKHEGDREYCEPHVAPPSCATAAKREGRHNFTRPA